MAKIVIDARESGTSTGRYVDKLVEYLQGLKPGFEIIVLTKTAQVDYLKRVAPDFKIVESNFKEFTFAEQIGFLRQLRGLKANLVHFTMPQQPVLYHGKTVTNIHDLTTTRFRNPAKNQLVFSIKQQIYKWLIRRVTKKSRKIITISDFVKRDVAQYTKIRPDKITVTYLAADKITNKAEPLSELNGKTFIIYVGRPQPHKNLERLIEALAILIQARPELKLVLVGRKDSLYERLEKFVSRKNLTNQVIFTGSVSEGQLRWLYENTAAYVFPSLSEGFGLPGLEAMVHGAPVVSSNATCLPEIYGDAAHYFDPKDIADMASKINQVLDDTKLKLELIKAGQEQARRYSWRKMAEQTKAVYEEVLDK